MDNFKKYLKYKNKYLNMKNQIGGNINVRLKDTLNDILNINIDDNKSMKDLLTEIKISLINGNILQSNSYYKLFYKDIYYHDSNSKLMSKLISTELPENYINITLIDYSEFNDIEEYITFVNDILSLNYINLILQFNVFLKLKKDPADEYTIYEKIKNITNRDFNLAIIKDDYKRFNYLNDIFITDKNFIIEVMKINGLAFEFVSKIFKEDREIALHAVENNGLALRLVSESFRQDRELVLIAVENNGLALEFASNILRQDRELVLIAVINNGLALYFASEILKEDRELVLAAEKNGYVLEFASE